EFPARWQAAVAIVIVVTGDGELVQVVLAVRPVGRLPDFLHRRHQERDQDAEDGDRHQQLDQREPVSRPRFCKKHSWTPFWVGPGANAPLHACPWRWTPSAALTQGEGSLSGPLQGEELVTLCLKERSG